MTLRVTNGRVAASRVRLHDGHEAPVPNRPRIRIADYNRLTGVSFTMGQGRPGRGVTWIRSAARGSAMANHHHDLNSFYSLLGMLAKLPRQGVRLSNCSGRSPWPSRGVYFFCEPGEFRKEQPKVARLVRVGTHALKPNSKSTLWSRLSAHRGATTGGGNHRGSIFRLHVGAAMLARDNVRVTTWGVGSSKPAHLKASRALEEVETAHEERVTEYLGALSVFWIDVADEPGPQSDRGCIERNAIALLSNNCRPADPASPDWLGNFSLSEKVRGCALWNVIHVHDQYDSAFLSKLEEYVHSTAAGS